MATTGTTGYQTDESWDEHYADERDAAWLYRRLASVDKNRERAELFGRLADVEDRHTRKWEELFRDAGRALPPYAVARRTQLLAWVAKTFGPSSVLPLILAEEGREVQAYLGLARQSTHEQTHKAAVDIAADSAVHARELSEVMGREGEPWHVGGAGGLLRSIVYGFNDGLTANFGLVAGVVGANMSPHVVIVTGVAGAIADALSMGSSGYLAAASEAEVQAHQIEMERQEMRLMPELEQEELSLLYQAKGIPTPQAEALAAQIMTDPARALEEQVREELKIGEATSTPMREAWITGTATALGAFIPVAPLLFDTGPVAIWTSFALAMLSHFAVGAARSFFTGRGIVRSGMDSSSWAWVSPSSATSWATGSSSCCSPLQIDKL